jgi:hypothetical protein
MPEVDQVLASTASGCLWDAAAAEWSGCPLLLLSYGRACWAWYESNCWYIPEADDSTLRRLGAAGRLAVVTTDGHCCLMLLG